MPKERIYNAISGPYEVQVGWHADSDVQVGVELHDAREEHSDYAGLPDRRSLLWQLFGNTENLVRFGRELGEHIKRTGYPTASHGWVSSNDAEREEAHMNFAIGVLMLLQDDWKPTGAWATLTREGCNKLIRVLRRARDSAFGRDE